METTVDKLEAMFQKSEADLDYIEKRLRLDFINNIKENGGSAEENPASLLENLSAIKAKHASLCEQVKEITAAQKESMDSIRNHLGSVMGLVQHLQQTTGAEVRPLTESEQESAEILGQAVTEMPSKVKSKQVHSSVETSSDQQPQSPELEELSEATLEAVPPSVRSSVKLAELNLFYRQLQQHFNSSSESLSVQKMKQLKMKTSDTKLKVLKYLSLIEVDSKGHVSLVM